MIITKTIDITDAISIEPYEPIQRDDLRFKDFDIITLAVECALATMAVTVVMVVVVVASDVDGMMVVPGVAVQCFHKDNRQYRHNQSASPYAIRSTGTISCIKIFFFPVPQL